MKKDKRNGILVFMLLKQIGRIFEVSYKSIHSTSLIVSVLLISIYYFNNYHTLDENYLTILGSVGLLSTFFLFGMGKLDFTEMLTTLDKDERRYNGKEYKQGLLLVNTYYSLILTQVILIGLQYTFYLFGIKLIALLFMSVIYMIIGFAFAVGGWHGYTLNKKAKR